MIAIFVIVFVLGVVYLYAYLDAKLPPEKPTEKRSSGVPIDLPEIRTAIHEAGHAISAWCCTLVINVETVVVKDGGHEGHVRSEYFALETPKARWCHLVILLSGVAAEAMIYRRGRSAGSKKDLMTALEHAESIADESPPWKKNVLHRSIDFSKMYEPRPSPQTIQNLEEGYRMAKHVLCANEARFYRVVSALLAKKSLSKTDLEPLLGSRKKMRFLMPFGPRFVIPEER